MTITYQVGGGGHMDIDFWVRSGLKKKGVAANASLCSLQTQTIMR